MVQVSSSNQTSDMVTEMTFRTIFNRKVFGFIIVAAFVLFFSSFMSQTVFAEKPQTRVKTAVSVQIKQGDTLWGIASEYYSEEYESLGSYIDEIMKSNGLASEEIHSGKYLIIPYYKDINS